MKLDWFYGGLISSSVWGFVFYTCLLLMKDYGQFHPMVFLPASYLVLSLGCMGYGIFSENKEGAQ